MDLHSSNDKPAGATASALPQIADCGASSEQKVAPSKAGPSRADLYFAAIGCAHSISDERIILHRDSSLPGNALSQLADRLIAAAGSQP